MTTSSNPLRDPADRRLPRIAGPSGLVIFGVTGDLSRKKLMPAIYDLANRGLLPPGFSLVGFARRDWERRGLRPGRARRGQGARADPVPRGGLDPARRGHSGSSPASSTTTRRSDRCGPPSRTWTRPAAPAATTRSTCRCRRSSSPRSSSSSRSTGCPRRRGESWRRVVIEKPFGHDLAERPGAQPGRAQVFPPNEVFRIDHYLGKETVQNILALRFANTMFEPIWNRSYVDHVQITMAEDIGIGGRAGYYDGIGAARDVIQNHLLQLLALTAMEEPVSFDAQGAGRREAQGASAPCELPEDLGKHTVRGQYAAGWQGGEKVRRLPARRTASTPSRRPTPTPPSSWRSTTAAGPACRSTCAPASGSAAGSPRSRWSSSAPRTCRSSPTATEELGAERPGHPGPAGRGRHGAVRLQGARHLDGGPRRHDGLRLRRVLHRVQPGGVRAAASWTSCSATPTSSRAHQEVELSWKILDPIEAVLGQRTASPRSTRRAPGARPRRTRCSHETDGAGAGHEDRPARTPRPAKINPALVEARAGDRHPGRRHGADPGHRHRRGQRLRRPQGGRRRLPRAPLAHPGGHQAARPLAARPGRHPARRRGAGRLATRAPARRWSCGCTASWLDHAAVRGPAAAAAGRPGGRLVAGGRPGEPGRRTRSARSPSAGSPTRPPPRTRSSALDGPRRGVLPGRHRPGLDPDHPLALACWPPRSTRSPTTGHLGAVVEGEAYNPSTELLACGSPTGCTCRSSAGSPTARASPRSGWRTKDGEIVPGPAGRRAGHAVRARPAGPARWRSSGATPPS